MTYEFKIHCKYDSLVDPKSLIDHKKNRNKHGQDQIERLSELYKYHGIRHPIIVSNLSGCIAAGHGRKLSAIRAGIQSFPVVYQDFKDADAEYAFMVSDNAISDWSELDMAGINSDLADLGPFDIDMLGIKDFELEPADKYGDQDADAIPEVKESIAKPGQIWKLGEHRVMCGDATNYIDVEKLMDGQKSDLIHTDPPYGIDYEGGSKKREKIANDDGIDLPSFLESTFRNYASISKPGGSIYVWHASTETHTFISKFIESGFLFKSYIVWNKDNSTFGRSDYHWKHEPAIYGWLEGAAHSWHGDRKQTTVWDIKRPSRSEQHPTMKPIELCETAIRNSSKHGDNVVDLFGGSGSTLIACEKTNRKCYMLELDPHYVDVIIKRWEDFTGQKAELLNG